MTSLIKNYLKFKMYRISKIVVLVTQFTLLIDNSKQSRAGQTITTLKAISKTIKNPLFKQIGNTIKKPITSTFSNTIKKSVSMFRQNKNTIKNLAFGLQEKYLKARHNFGSKSIRYFGERHNFRSKTVKYLREQGIKKFKYMQPQTIRGSKQNIMMRSDAQMKGKELRSLINTVSKSKSQLPLLLATGGLGKLTQLNLIPEEPDSKEKYFGKPIDAKKKDNDPIPKKGNSFMNFVKGKLFKCCGTSKPKEANIDIFKNSLIKPRTERIFSLQSLPYIAKACTLMPCQVFCFTPITLSNALVEGLTNKLLGRPRIPQYVTVTTPNFEISPKKERKYDAVVFGSTGYIGRLLVDYLAKAYGPDNVHESKKLKWAIVGRNESSLKKLKEDITKKYPFLDSLNYIVANSRSFSQVEEVVNQAKVVMTTVGPYSVKGNELINACALYGTDYVDLTGDADWQQKCITNMQDLAVKSGARLVSFCGIDSIPWDLSTHFMHEEFKNKHNQSLKKIQFYQQKVADISGGTVSSIFEMFTRTKYITYKDRFPGGEDPWKFVPGEHKTKDLNIVHKNTRNPHYDCETKKWVGFSIMAGVNYRAIERSNVLTGYGDKIEYGETVIYRNFLQMTDDILTKGAFATTISSAALQLLAKKTILPEAGEVMRGAKPGKHYLSMWAIGTGTEGKKLYNEMHFHKEPGCAEPARLLAESGLSFVFNDDQIEVGGGFWTPASALNKVLLNRITKTGTDFRFYDPSKNSSDENTKKDK